MKTTSKYATIAENEKKRADLIADRLKEITALMEKVNQERDADRKEIDRLRTHNRLMRGTLEVEELELRARLKLIGHRIAMVPVDPRMIEGAVGRWTVSDANLRLPSDYDRATRIANEALENLKESLKP